MREKICIFLPFSFLFAHVFHKNVVHISEGGLNRRKKCILPCQQNTMHVNKMNKL